jgi:hypothetical protein
MIRRSSFMAILLLLCLSNCTTVATSNPPRTATEEMLISTAAERASSRLSIQIPQNTKVFIDSGNFEGTDSKYAISAIRGRLLQKGLLLVDDKKNADVIVEIRSGALSIDHKTFLIGIPQFNVPVPFASAPLTFPEIAFYSSDAQKGVAKFADSAYYVKQGTLAAEDDPQYGFSYNTKKTAMIFVSWTETDAMPENAIDEDDAKLQTVGPHSQISLSNIKTAPAAGTH